jgi:hypothetical protein
MRRSWFTKKIKKKKRKDTKNENAVSEIIYLKIMGEREREGGTAALFSMLPPKLR